MAAASASFATASSSKRTGANLYTHGTLDGNWFEDRAREEAGEFVQVPLMVTPEMRTRVLRSK
eukprot:scaffold48515_cov32-Tisochrysis_lutea.AAC.1